MAWPEVVELMSKRNPIEAATILVVEDEFLLRDMVAEFLRECGWNVLEAESGEDALLRLGEAENIDLVFTDLRLGGPLNGWDVGEAFRHRLPGLPVIYTTGLGIEPQRRVAGSLFFDKPYTPEQIHAACEQLLNEPGNPAGARR